MILQIAKLIAAIAFLLWVIAQIVIWVIRFESKKPSCENCARLIRKENGFYSCSKKRWDYRKSPEYCCHYEPRKENHDQIKETPSL